MSVSSLTNKIRYNGDGTTTVFSFPYYFTAFTDLVVYVYDTVAGGTTLQTLGSTYTVSGTANAQGLYPSGGSVTFGSAPASTAIIVIYRDPTRLQNYSLLQNGQISSTALVQQMDYLTLLIQRLEDQIQNCIQVPDGVGFPVTPQLPPNVIFAGGMFPQINEAGNGWVLAGGPFIWQNVVIPYTSLQASSTTNTIQLFSAYPKALIVGIAIKHSVAFSGTSITALKLDVGVPGNLNTFIDHFDGYQAVSDTAFDYIVPNYLGSWANSTNVELTATSVGANLSALSAGSVTIYYLVQNLAI